MKETALTTKEALINLYNAIMSEYSVRRNTLSWSDVTQAIEKRYKNFEKKTDVYFDDNVVNKAIEMSSGKLKETIEGFAREMGYNKQTLSEKNMGR
jgi:predicted ATPase